MVTIWYAIFNQYINMDARWNNARCPISAFETCLAIFSLWVWAGSWRVRPSSGRARSYARLCGRGSGAPGSRQRHLAVDEATTPARSHLTYRSHLPPSFLFRDLSRRNVSYCQKKEKEKEKEKRKKKKETPKSWWTACRMKDETVNHRQRSLLTCVVIFLLWNDLVKRGLIAAQLLLP